MIDILFTPTNPISGRYTITSQTLLGWEWCERYCISRVAYSSRDIRQLTARLDAMGLTFHINWAFALPSASTMENSHDHMA